MNAVQLHQNFLVKTNSLMPGEAALDIPLIVIEELFNTAQDILIRKYYKIFDEGEKSKKVLMDLIVDLKSNGTTAFYTDNFNYPNGTYVDLDLLVYVNETTASNLTSELRYIIYDSEEAFIVNRTTNATSVARTRPIMYKEYVINRNNPFKKSYEEVVVRLEHGSLLHELIIPDGCFLSAYRLKYIKNPQRIVIAANNTPEIDDTIHNELLDLSVDLYLKSIAVNSAIKQGNINTQNK